MSSWNQTKIIFGCYLRGKSQLHEGGCLAVGGVLLGRLQSSGAGVVAVSADMVRRANPGGKKRAFGEVSAGR